MWLKSTKAEWDAPETQPKFANQSNWHKEPYRYKQFKLGEDEAICHWNILGMAVAENFANWFV